MRLTTILLGLLMGSLSLLPLTCAAMADDKSTLLRVAYDTDPVSLDIHEQLAIGMLQLSHREQLAIVKASNPKGPALQGEFWQSFDAQGLEEQIKAERTIPKDLPGQQPDATGHRPIHLSCLCRGFFHNHVGLQREGKGCRGKSGKL